MHNNQSSTSHQVTRNRYYRYGALLRHKSTRLIKKLGFRDDSFLIIMALLVGAATGAGSVIFTRLIDLAHDFCYGGGHSESQGLYGGHWYLLLILPAAGALLVGLITFFFAREAKGHGVPEVMNAIAVKDGHIRPRVAVAKAIASALTIGSGGSAGTEGPIIQIGAALGSAMGRSFQLVKHHMPVLVGCGAAAGISAIFHAPIAGVLFALEIFLRELNFRTFAPVMIASVISSVTVSALLGTNEAIFPLLNAKTLYAFHWTELGNYVILGLLAAGAAIGFIRLLYWAEDLFEKLAIHEILKPVLGAIGLGLIGLITVLVIDKNGMGEPSIFGNGYRVIGQCIGGDNHHGRDPVQLGIPILATLLVLKLLATCFTLGSGGSGGVFAPSLFMGAVVGYGLGLALQATGIWQSISPETYALVGMASVVAASTHAPMTAIIILFEMTRNYQIILPVMFSATIALAVAQLLYRDSIYTLKLRRKGVHYEARAKTAILRRIMVQQVMQCDYDVVHNDMPLQDVIQHALDTDMNDFIVTDNDGRYIGLLTGNDLRAALLQPEAMPFLVAGELARQNIPAVSATDTLDKTLDLFSRLEANSMPVHSPDNDTHYVGMITRADLMRRYQRELESAD